MKKTILTLIMILCLLNSIGFAEEYLEEYNETMEKAIVLEAGKKEKSDKLHEESSLQRVKIRIISGKHKGEIFDIENHLSDNDAYNIFVEKNDKVLVIVREEGEELSEIFIADFHRSNHIVYLIILFTILILIIGRTKGLKAIISLIFTIGGVFYILLPQILKGRDPIVLSVMISVVVTILTIFLVSGINFKSISAIIGTSVGVIIAGFIAYYIGTKVKLTGLSADEATMLMYIPQEIEFNFRNLLFSGIILGSLGAVMDVGMSIASSIEEIYIANNNLTKKELFASGMNVGKDVMGTMTNTLILAYTGSSIPLLLLLMAYETPLIEIINSDIVATEIIRSLSGSIGLVLTIPITAMVASILIKKHRRGDDIKDE